MFHQTLYRVTPRMKVAALLLGCSALLVLPYSAHSSEENASKELEACLEKAGGNTFSMIDCTNLETEKQDKRLNENFQTLVKQISSERAKALRATQRLWIQYRDANCDFYLDPDGGQKAKLDASSCYLDETTKRADELKDFLVGSEDPNDKP